MHELSIAMSLIKAATDVAKRENVRRLVSVTVQVGPMSGVVPESLEFAFPFAAKGTMLEGAALKIEKTELRLHCNTCDKDGPAEPMERMCPTCNGMNIKIVQGDEIVLKSLEGS